MTISFLGLTLRSFPRKILQWNQTLQSTGYKWLLCHRSQWRWKPRTVHCILWHDWQEWSWRDNHQSRQWGENARERLWGKWKLCSQRLLHSSRLTGLSQLAFLADVSTHCEQFIKYECRDTLLFRSNTGWWVSRTGDKMTYWGGATPADHNKCTCGVTSPNSCANTAYGCNCDKNDGTFREDSGLLKRKSDLPVTQLRFGDTGHSGEEGFHTLGKLKCYGMQ